MDQQRGTHNADGSYTPQSAEEISARRYAAGERFADARDNGQLISSSSNVISDGNGGYNKITNNTWTSPEGQEIHIHCAAGIKLFRSASFKWKKSNNQL
jgi:hypothetical protein